MVQLPTGGSAAQNPDLDWSQVRETILMLGITVAQVQHAMDEGSASFNTLANSFAETSNHIEALKGALSQTALPAELQLEQKIAEISDKNIQSIIAFQFFDRLSQRLDHVCKTISELAGLVSDRSSIYQPDAWLALQKNIRSQYTMEQEKILFDAILSGAPFHEALALAGNVNINPDQKDKAGSDGGIELF
ncbi:hypothetical protein K4H28_03695 [Deefgea tanakiae]|uniref:Chemotaxis protein n=1 Tax=Deefgea tanakiae TaxID=2865840 RepID=A0ABX8Z7H3_9NEIS|nr:hypothetical protein [Deefgea tanakiae]QZA78532.1 hypothetical protein K4H28_03695 [Deefgea tanakiae]